MPDPQMLDLDTLRRFVGTEVAELTEFEVFFDAYERMRTALLAIDGMRPEDFQGDGHLAPAFRRIDPARVMRFIGRQVNRALYDVGEDTDVEPGSLPYKV